MGISYEADLCYGFLVPNSLGSEEKFAIGEGDVGNDCKVVFWGDYDQDVDDDDDYTTTIVAVKESHRNTWCHCPLGVSDLLNEASPIWKWNNILRAVCERYGIDPDTMKFEWLLTCNVR